MTLDRYRIEWQCSGGWLPVEGWYFFLATAARHAAGRAIKTTCNIWVPRCFRVVRNRDGRVMMLVVTNPRGPKDRERRRRWLPLEVTDAARAAKAAGERKVG